MRKAQLAEMTVRSRCTVCVTCRVPGWPLPRSASASRSISPTASTTSRRCPGSACRSSRPCWAWRVCAGPGAPRPTRTTRRRGACSRPACSLSVVALVSKPLARYMADPRPWAHPDLLVAVGAASVVAVSVRPATAPPHGAAPGLLIVAVGLWLGAWTVRESPTPAHRRHARCTRQAFASLARGESPYAITFDEHLPRQRGLLRAGHARRQARAVRVPVPAAQPAAGLAGPCRCSATCATARSPRSALAAALLVSMRSGRGIALRRRPRAGAARSSSTSNRDGPSRSRSCLAGAHRGDRTCGARAGVAAARAADGVEAAHGARPGVRADARGRRARRVARSGALTQGRPRPGAWTGRGPWRRSCSRRSAWPPS